jgi:hypothetical protein
VQAVHGCDSEEGIKTVEELEARLELATRERDKFQALAELSNGYRRERNRARAEVDRLTDERDELLEAYDAKAYDEWDRSKYSRAKITTAYRRGAEAMREACAKVDPYNAHRSNAAFARSVDSPASVVRIMQEAIRALPIPEEP